MEKRYYGVKELIDLCKMLAPSQGFYGRLLAQINAMPLKDLKDLDDEIRTKKFTDNIALILWLEA